MLLQTVFSTVLNMSITASIAILVILLARIVLKRTPKIFSYALWAVVLFRLLCPVSLTSGFSLIGLVPAPTTETGRIEYVSLNEPTTERPAITVDIPASALNQTTDNRVEPSIDEVVAADSIDFPVTIVSIVWICGVAAMLVFHLLQLIRLRRKLIGSIPLKDNIYLADYIPTPFVMGLIHPKIYLPSAMPETEQSYIIQHEKHHIRRCDHIIKLLAFVAVCMHWFNPLVWLAFALSSKDMEMSCDEAVMKQTGRDIRADYSSSLLQFSTGKRVILGTPLAFGEGDTKERIENIMRYKRLTMIIVVLAVIVCVGLTACLSSNPQSDAEKNNLSAIGALKEEDVGKTLSELKNEHPEGEIIVSLDGFPDSAAICFGEPEAEYAYYFFGTQSGDAEKAMNECEDQLKCAGFITTANILFPDMEDEMSFEDFFSLIGVDDYEYLGEDTTAAGWLRFTYHGMEVVVNTNEATANGGWDFTGAEIVKRNAPVSIADPEIVNTNSDLADAVMFDLTTEYYDNSTDAVSLSPEQYRTETGNFENIMGFSGYWTQQIGITCGRTYYTHTSQGQVPIAESFGYEIDDYISDLDGDGTTELICNVTYGFDAVERIYVYRLHDGVVERGYINEETVFSPSDIWGVGAIAERYDAEQKKFLLTLTKEDGSTQTHEQSDYTHFVWETYADITAASSGQ